MTAHELTEMAPTLITERLEQRPLLVLGFGTIEWHSHHLPVGLDGLVADDLCRAIADRADAVIAPTSYWAVGGVPFPYTLTLPIEVIEPLLVSVFEQFASMGFRLIVAFTGHFGLEQTLALKRAAVTVMRGSPVTILPLTPYDLVTELYTGDHASVGETSLLLAARPDLVHLDALSSDTPLEGVIGEDPRGIATAEHGQRVRSLIVERTAALADRMLKQTAPDQREQFVEAIDQAALALAELADARRRYGRSAVPGVQTPPYLAHCAALWEGDYVAAKQHAEQKREETGSWDLSGGPIFG